MLVPGDRADAADGRALPGALRRHRRAAALRAGRGRALRRVAAAALAARRGSRSGRARRSSRRSRGLGLVVVDEEHDASYKHEGDPRYDARRVAAERARRAGARAAGRLGARRGPETWHALPRLDAARARRRPAAAARAGARHARHARTRCTPRRGARSASARKAIVLLNRRGWSNFLTCRTCGKVWECPQCDVALVLHRAQGAIACHHCGHREPRAASAATPAARSPSPATARAPSASSTS